MKKLLSLIIVLAAILPLFAQVGIIVDRDLYPSVRNSIKQYKTDLTSRIPVNVWIDSTTFNSTSSVVSLRDSLISHFQTTGLEGAVLIGDLPIAMYEIENDFGTDGYTNFPCDLYFMDLDGTWQDNAQAGAWNGNAKTGHFDNHIDGFGTRTPEIWVSRIVPAATPGLGSEDAIINDYFARLHLHMTGKYSIPHMLLTFGNSDEWPGLRTEMGDGLWFSSNETVQFSSGFDSGSIWTKELRKGYQYANVYEHSGPDGHAMINGFNSSSFLNMPSTGAKSNIRFSNLFACSNARYTYPNFLGGLYGWGHNGLISVGSTKTGAMLGFNAYNQRLGAGLNFGLAFKDWFTQVGLSNVSWHYGMTLLGVGTLYFYPYYPDVYTPTDLKVTSISPTQFRITWVDNSYNETGYLLERATSEGSFTQVSVLSANTWQTVNSVPTGGKYFYRVRAYNSSDTTIYSNVDSSATFTNIAPTRTATTSSAQSGNTIANAIDNSTSTRWAASSGSFPQWYKVDLGGPVPISGCEIVFERAGTSGDCYDFTIETSDDNSYWTTKVTLLSNNNTDQTQSFNFSDTARYVRITFSDAPGNYYASMYEFRVIGDPCPPAPTLISSIKIVENQNTITWAPSPGATYYTIKRSTIQGGPYTWCESGLTGTSYNTTNLVADSVYYFVLSASNASGESPNSNELLVYSEVSIPVAPMYPWFDSKDTLRWNDNSHNENGFDIERSPYNQENWTFVGQVWANQRKFYDADRLNYPYTTFKYRVHAYNSAGFSSNTESVTPVLHGPYGVSAYPAGHTVVYVNWSINGINHEGFHVERSTDGINFQRIATLGPQVYMLTDNVSVDNTYFYRVNSFNASGTSYYAETVSVSTPPNAPSGLSANAVSNSQINLSWTDNSNIEIGFSIQEAPDGTQDFQQIATVGPNVTTYSRTGLNEGTTYQYRVIAFHSQSVSNPSNIASATTLSSDPCSGVQGGGNGLKGTVFGLNPPWASGSEYCKATDGNTSTFYDYSQANGGYAGIDLGTARVIGKIKYYPRANFASRMVGGKFQGSNTSSTSGFVDLYTISSTPGTGWNEISISNTTAYRWVRYLSPDNGYANIAEMEFYQPAITFEAENSNPSASSVGYNVSSGDAANSNSAFVQLSGTPSVGAWLQFNLPDIAAGNYNITVYYKAYYNRGIFQGSIDGSNLGGTCDEYNSSVVYQKAFNMGSRNLSAGNHTIRFTVTGKNSSSAAYALNIDKIVLTQQ